MLATRSHFLHGAPGWASPTSSAVPPKVRTFVERRRRPTGHEEFQLTNSPAVPAASNGRSHAVAALLEAAQALLENRAFGDASRAVLSTCRTILGAGAGLVVVCAAARNRFEVVHLDTAGLELDAAGRLPLPIRRLGARARKGRTVFANDLARRDNGRSPSIPALALKSALFAPINLAGEVAGLLGLVNKPGGFVDADAQLAEVFAEMAAMAMSRSRTVQGFESRRTALEGQVRDAASQLSLSERKFRVLVENLPDVVARFDPGLRHVYVSAAAHSMTGTPLSDYLGRTNHELGMPAELVEPWNAALRRVFATERPEKVELACPAPEGTRHFDCRIFPERDAAGVVLSVLSVARDVTELRAAYESERVARRQMQSLSRRLVEAQESERRNIARELHDEAGQALASLRFGLRLLEREIDEGGNVTGRVTELMQRTDAVIDGLHRLAVDLRPASLDHLGLEAALRQLTRSTGSRFGLAVRFKARGSSSERLPAAVETALYRVVQEALTNVVRHARATRVDVLVQRRGDRVIVMVEDDGVGFEPEPGQRGDSARTAGAAGARRGAGWNADSGERARDGDDGRGGGVECRSAS